MAINSIWARKAGAIILIIIREFIWTSQIVIAKQKATELIYAPKYANVKTPMKQTLYLSLFTLLLSCGSKFDPFPVTRNDKKCNIYNGKQLYLEKKGNCYYIDRNNNKAYVTKSDCNC